MKQHHDMQRVLLESYQKEIATIEEDFTKQKELKGKLFLENIIIGIKRFSRADRKILWRSRSLKTIKFILPLVIFIFPIHFAISALLPTLQTFPLMKYTPKIGIVLSVVAIWMFCYVVNWFYGLRKANRLKKQLGGEIQDFSKENIRHNENIIHENNAYWLIKENNIKTGPFCTQCQDNNNKLILLHSISGSDLWRCPTCKNSIRIPLNSDNNAQDGKRSNTEAF